MNTNKKGRASKRKAQELLHTLCTKKSTERNAKKSTVVTPKIEVDSMESSASVVTNADATNPVATHTGESSSNPTTETPCTSAKTSSSTQTDFPNLSVKPRFISPKELYNDLLTVHSNSETLGTLLLIVINQLKLEMHIKFYWSVNLVLEAFRVNHGYKLDTEPSMIRFLMGYCSKLMKTPATGGKKTIVIIEESLVDENNVPKGIKFLESCFHLLNKDKDTVLRILDGGIKKFAEAYPQMITNNLKDCFTPVLWPLYNWQTEVFQTLIQVEPLNVKETMINLWKQLSSVANVLGISKDLLRQLQRQKITREIKTDQIAKHNDTVDNELSKVVPDYLRCSSCKEIYTDKVYQCLKGHAFCWKIDSCSKCGPDIPFEIARNTLIENVIREENKYKCPSCNNLFSCCNLEKHVKKCMETANSLEFKRASKELVEIEEEITKLREKLEQANLDMIQAENWWVYLVDQKKQQLPEILNFMITIYHEKKMELAKVSSEIIAETIFENAWEFEKVAKSD